MTFPSDAAVQSAIPGISDVTQLDSGGQKIVYTCAVEDAITVLKLLKLDRPPSEDGGNEQEQEQEQEVDEIFVRAQREYDILEKCNVETVVKAGPIGLNMAEIDGDQWLYFTEEFIEGQNLASKLTQEGFLGVSDAVQLASDMAEAIEAMWLIKKIHRDIKPKNIMWCEPRSRFVLLDPGMAFDVDAPSVTLPGAIVGTPSFLSPEQMDPRLRRTMDFRSDLFSLGIVLYESAVGQHPFALSGNTTFQVMSNILQATPQPPSTINPGVPDELNDVIMRLLGKRPNLRYRTIPQFQQALAQVPVS